MEFGWPNASSVKFAVAHRRGWNQARERNPVPLILLLEIYKEKRLVLLDRATQREAELIEIEFFGDVGEEAAGVQIGIAEELEDASMELVASRFRGHQNRGARRASPIPRNSCR